jgi:hypothetical protein
MTEDEIEALTAWANANPETITFGYDTELKGWIVYFHDEKSNFFGAMHPLCVLDILLKQ